MSWRVVVITKRCKLEYKLGYLICRGEQLKKSFSRRNRYADHRIDRRITDGSFALRVDKAKNKCRILRRKA